MRFLSVLTLVLFFGINSLNAQQRLTKSKLYAGYNSFGVMKITVGAGTAWYYGDLCTNCINPKANLNIGLQFRFTDRLSGKAELNWYQIGATDVYESRGLDFTSNNFEVFGAMVLDLFPHSTNFYSRKKINPYAMGGLGFTYFNPRAEYNGETYSLRPLQTEGVAYSPVTLIIPFGLGIRFRATHFLDVAIEGGYRVTFTDYLDDVSTVYTDIADAEASAVATRGMSKSEGAIRGNPDSRDGYFTASVRAEITLPSVRGGGGNGQRAAGVHISKLTKKNRKRMLKNRK